MKKAFQMNQTWLQCINCGHKSDLLKERAFLCPECGDLYEVQHDFKNVVMPSAKVLSDRLILGFDAKAPAWQRSGVWRYKELIMPFLPEKHVVTLGEGNSPIVRAGKNLSAWLGNENTWLILEGTGPTGAFKDYGMTVAISVAKAAGIEAVVCASTGDTSAAAAAYAAAAGMKCAVVLPKGKVTAAQLVQPLNSGATVITLPTNFDGCMRVVRELVEMYGAFPVNSLNPTRIEGHMATVFQLAQFFDRKMHGWIAVPVGNGSNSSSIAKGLRTLRDVLNIYVDGCHILGCQSAAANPLARSWQPMFGKGDVASGFAAWSSVYEDIETGETTATAAKIGAPVSREKVMQGIIEFNGSMTTAREKDLNEAVDVCGRDGYFICPQTGTALAGVREAVIDGTIKCDERVVVVSTALGLKFTESAVRGKDADIINAPNYETSTVAKIMGL
jgi:threonine synthase